MSLRLFFIFSVFVFSLIETVHAELTFCNKSPSQLVVAVGYHSNNVWKSKGWWNIAPNECATPLGGSLNKTHYYYYAKDAAGGKWEGNHYFCTTSSKFTIAGDENCSGRGYNSTGFKEIKVGNNTRYKLTLTGGGNRGNGRWITRVQTKHYTGVRNCLINRATKEVANVCNEVQANLVASGYTIVRRGKQEYIDSDGKIERFCTDRLPFGGTCVGYGNRCSGWVKARCHFMVR